MSTDAKVGSGGLREFLAAPPPRELSKQHARALLEEAIGDEALAQRLSESEEHAGLLLEVLQPDVAADEIVAGVEAEQAELIVAARRLAACFSPQLGRQADEAPLSSETVDEFVPKLVAQQPRSVVRAALALSEMSLLFRTLQRPTRRRRELGPAPQLQLRISGPRRIWTVVRGSETQLVDEAELIERVGARAELPDAAEELWAHGLDYFLRDRSEVVGLSFKASTLSAGWHAGEEYELVDADAPTAFTARASQGAAGA